MARRAQRRTLRRHPWWCARHKHNYCGGRSVCCAERDESKPRCDITAMEVSRTKLWLQRSRWTLWNSPCCRIGTPRETCSGQGYRGSPPCGSKDWGMPLHAATCSRSLLKYVIRSFISIPYQQLCPKMDEQSHSFLIISSWVWWELVAM